MSDFVGCTIIDHVLGDRRGVILSIDEPSRTVFVQWEAKHASTVAIQAGRFSVLRKEPSQ
jgi:hypothetical protein